MFRPVCVSAVLVCLSTEQCEPVSGCMCLALYGTVDMSQYVCVWVPVYVCVCVCVR